MMGENSKIEWTTHTMNFWIGCQEVSAACDFCYAREQNEFRKWVAGWGPDGERRRTSMGNWHKLRKWNREAGELGIRAKVFSNSLSDFFDNDKNVSISRREAWHYIEQSPNLDFLLLTKRPQNIRKMLPDPESGVSPWGDGWPNVWLGTTAENQQEADRRIPHLLAVPARKRFLSCEPLLGPIEISDYLRIRWPAGEQPGCRSIGMPCRDIRQGDGYSSQGENCYARGWCPGIDWIIAGGESDTKRRARPMHVTWARSLRDQCAEAGVPFFFKQWGDWARWEPRYTADPGRLIYLGVDGSYSGNPGIRREPMVRIGKKAAGALLDGVSHKAMPV